MLDDLNDALSKCAGDRRYGRRQADLVRLRDALVGAGGSDAALESQAKDLLNEIKSVRAEDVASVDEVWKATGQTPPATDFSPSAGPPASTLPPIATEKDGSRPPPPPMPSQPLSTARPYMGKVRGGDKESLDDAVKAQTEEAVHVETYTTLEEELEAINRALASEGLNYRVGSIAQLRTAKKAAGLGATKKPHPDFAQFRDKLFKALRLGALGGQDTDDAEKVLFANQFVEIFKEELEDYPDHLDQLGNNNYSYDALVRLSQAVSEIPLESQQPRTLAENIIRNLGAGPLAGMLETEVEEVGKDEAGPVRASRMSAFGMEIVEYLKPLGVSPEITGSLVLAGGSYDGVPDDLDINIKTSGDDKARKETWETVVDYMNEYDGESIREDSGHVFIRPMNRGRVDPENPGIWERRYCYQFKPAKGDDREGFVVPFEVEVKDVGGAIWSEHLSDQANERSTQDNAMSAPAWLMLDVMKRILDLRDGMVTRLAQEPDAEALEPEVPSDSDPDLKDPKVLSRIWRESIIDKGRDLADGKRLMKKLRASVEMAEEAMGEERLRSWVQKTAKEPARFRELIDLSRSRKEFNNWLTSI